MFLVKLLVELFDSSVLISAHLHLHLSLSALPHILTSFHLGHDLVELICHKPRFLTLTAFIPLFLRRRGLLLQLVLAITDSVDLVYFIEQVRVVGNRLLLGEEIRGCFSFNTCIHVLLDIFE